MHTRSIYLGVLVSLLIGLSAPGSWALAKLRISTGAVIQADELTLRQIEEAFNRAEEAMENEDLETLMQLYSIDYRYQTYTKDDMRKIWKDFFQKYDRITSLHAFSKVVVKPGKPPTAEIVCTGSLWATDSVTHRRVNLASWLGNTHYLVYERGEWRIKGQGVKASPTSPFGKTVPPPLF
ncbi:MAG: hypothetical protein D6690_00670 [Nitrospirae bacterium]|nr:MAG: hypothetical protein D6690_00670 [Nitrospirota bacterium]